MQHPKNENEKHHEAANYSRASGCEALSSAVGQCDGNSVSSINKDNFNAIDQDPEQHQMHQEDTFDIETPSLAPSSSAESNTPSHAVSSNKRREEDNLPHPYIMQTIDAVAAAEHSINATAFALDTAVINTNPLWSPGVENLLRRAHADAVLAHNILSDALNMKELSIVPPPESAMLQNKDAFEQIRWRLYKRFEINRSSPSSARSRGTGSRDRPSTILLNSAGPSSSEGRAPSERKSCGYGSTRGGGGALGK